MLLSLKALQIAQDPSLTDSDVKTLDDFTYTNFGAIINGNEATFPNTNSYIMLNEYFDPGSNAWEISYRMKNTSSYSEQAMIGPEIDYTNFTSCVWNYRPKLWLDTNGKSNWDIDQWVEDYSLPSVKQNATYTIKIAWDKAYYSSTWIEEDSGTVLNDYKAANSNPMYVGSHLILGNEALRKHPFRGILYLDSFRFKIFE